MTICRKSRAAAVSGSKEMVFMEAELELEGLRTGENELGIELVGSRRNALGPFFLSNPHPLRFGANEFREYAHPEYRNLTPYGLFTPPMLLMQYPGS